jgi:hypothetical protein
VGRLRCTGPPRAAPYPPSYAPHLPTTVATTALVHHGPAVHAQKAPDVTPTRIDHHPSHPNPCYFPSPPFPVPQELLLRTDATLHLQDSRGYTVRVSCRLPTVERVALRTTLGQCESPTSSSTPAAHGHTGAGRRNECGLTPFIAQRAGCTQLDSTAGPAY